MSAAAQDRIARFFAPELLFHPAEEFYPTDVLTPFGDLSNPTPEDAAALAIDRRVRAYLAMPVKERLRFATVYCRVTPLAARSGRRVAVEYFFYYLYNPYRVRGALFPLAFNVSHPHDFETLVFVVEWPEGPSADAWDPARGRVVGIYPSDHAGDVPDNVWRARGDEAVPRPLHVIVELGSHAMAADLNENGRFDPGIDMNRPAKFVWGIRDAGGTWAHFKPGHMDTREPGRCVTLVGPGGEDAPNSYTYDLAPVSALTDAMALIARLAGDKGFGRATWAMRLFGDVDPRTAVRVPPPPVDPERGTGEATAAAYEHGLSVGVSNLLSVISFYGGGRWLVAAPPRLPDLLLDAQAVVTNDRHFYYTLDSFASYRLDYISRLVVGVGVLGRTAGVHSARTDLLAGVEFRLGHLRVRPLARHNHPLRRTWAELRVTYVF